MVKPSPRKGAPESVLSFCKIIKLLEGVELDETLLRNPSIVVLKGRVFEIACFHPMNFFFSKFLNHSLPFCFLFLWFIYLLIFIVLSCKLWFVVLGEDETMRKRSKNVIWKELEMLYRINPENLMWWDVVDFSAWISNYKIKWYRMRYSNSNNEKLPQVTSFFNTATNLYCQTISEIQVQINYFLLTGQLTDEKNMIDEDKKIMIIYNGI